MYCKLCTARAWFLAGANITLHLDSLPRNTSGGSIVWSGLMGLIDLLRPATHLAGTAWDSNHWWACWKYQVDRSTWLQPACRTLPWSSPSEDGDLPPCREQIIARREGFPCQHYPCWWGIRDNFFSATRGRLKGVECSLINENFL